MTDPVQARREWLSEAINSNGAIDVAAMSEEGKEALSDAGLPETRLAAVAGKDGRIDSADEALALFNTVERFVPEAKREPLREALLEEFRRHSVRSLGAGDALTLTADEARYFRPTSVPVPGVDQFSLSKDPKVANHLCYQAAEEQVRRFYTQAKVPMPPLGGAGDRIQVALHETTSGRVESDGAAAIRARAYVDDALDAGRPVLVGVSAVSLASGRVNEGITEHFVTISGRGVDDQDRAYYEFKDPGAGGRSDRFYVDPETGKLFKPGKNLAELGGAGYAQDMLYEMSQVRTYKDLPPR